jgi:hypothetical protein
MPNPHHGNHEPAFSARLEKAYAGNIDNKMNGFQTRSQPGGSHPVAGRVKGAHLERDCRRDGHWCPACKIHQQHADVLDTGLFAEHKPRTVLFTSGDETEAKQRVIELINSTGLVAIDLGSLRMGDAETLAFFAEHLGRLSKTREDVKTLFEFGELDDYVSFGGKA